jgi:UDP-glucuronate 4-epimerase
MPYKETDKADFQVSFYAATKKSTENMAHSYAHLYNLPITMFRFFTVYGPWGRPDMALFKFTKAILDGNKIDVYNYGDLSRDFTYIDDLIRAIRLLIDLDPNPKTEERQFVATNENISPVAPFRVVNIGRSKPEKLLDFIGALEKALNIKAEKNLMPMQAGDVSATWADTRLLFSLTGFKPSTSISTGVAKFVSWYRDYYKV